MTATAPTSTETVASEQQASTPEVSENNENKQTVTLSEFIANALREKNSGKSWYQQSNKDNHHKTPNRPPHGTRRSMGKR